MNKYWVWLSSIYKIGAVNQNKLLEQYKTPERIFKLTKSELEENTYLNKEQIDIIWKSNRNNLDKYIEYMINNNIELITIEDDEYPDKLKTLFDPPITLYIKGNKKILNNKSIAIIGSRNCSMYGKVCAETFAYDLSKRNIIIISGLARGIDGFAHIGTIKNKKQTIAVMRVWIRSDISTRE